MEPEEGHVLLKGFRGTVRVPKLQAALHIIESSLPVASNVTFESLSEDRIELLNVLLQAHNIRVQCEHVVHALILEGLNVDGLVLGQLDQVADLVILRNQVVVDVVE